MAQPLDAALLGKIVERLLGGETLGGDDRIAAVEFAAGAWNLSCIRLTTDAGKTFVISISEDQAMPADG